MSASGSQCESNCVLKMHWIILLKTDAFQNSVQFSLKSVYLSLFHTSTWIYKEIKFTDIVKVLFLRNKSTHYNIMSIKTFCSFICDRLLMHSKWGKNEICNFGVKAQWRAKHTICRSMLALRVGVKMMMRCCRIDPAMMRCLPADIPPVVRSLADEVDELGARFHTSTT